jgi:hypothetical protein
LVAVFSFALIVVMAIAPQISHAYTYTEYLLLKAGVRIDTAVGVWTAKQERTHIATLYNDYLDQQKRAGRAAVGQVAIDGFYPTAFRSAGETVALTFLFVATDTLANVPTAGPSVASVEYRVNTDPYDPTSFTTIGSSTDAGADFRMAYVVGPNEPTIEALPRDALGDPVVLLGVNSENVARGLATHLVSDGSVDVGLNAAPASISLGVDPNPSGGWPVVAFSLAGKGPATLEVFDVAGRRVCSSDVSRFGPGHHSLRVGNGPPRSGMYLIRLVTEDGVISRRFVIMRP